MMNRTPFTRILARAGWMMFLALAAVAFMVPGGALEGRATSLRIDEPAEVTTTTTMAPVAAEPAPAPAPVTTTTTTAPPAAVPAPKTPPTTEIGQAATITKPQSGQYACPGGMTSANQYDPGADCALVDATDPGPVNASPNNDPALPAGLDGDQPGQTLGSTDAAYGAWLSARSCEVKPWTC